MLLSYVKIVSLLVFSVVNSIGRWNIFVRLMSILLMIRLIMMYGKNRMNSRNKKRLMSSDIGNFLRLR